MKLMQNATWTEKSETFLKNKNLLSHIKMGKEILTFGNIEIEKNKFYHHKTPVPIRGVVIEKVLASNKIYFG